MVILVACSSFPEDLILFDTMISHSDEQLDEFRVWRTKRNSGFILGGKASEFYALSSFSQLDLYIRMFTSRLCKDSDAIMKMLEYSQM